MNELIERIFANYTYPIAFMHYVGSSETYITYQQTHIDTTFSADNEIQDYLDYYDFDIYSKGNYLQIIEDIKTIVKQNGGYFIPSMCSGDMYEEDTRYYHKTLCFAFIRN